MSDSDQAQVRFDQAIRRLSGALERIVDGLDNVSAPPAREPESGHDAEVDELRARVAVLERENQSLREAGRAAATGIGETIAALEAARS